MAKGRRRSRKMEPAVQTFTFDFTVPGAAEPGAAAGSINTFIDLSQCASLLNRRFYRQGINWAVSGIKILTTPSTPAGVLNGSIAVSKVPETWVMSNAWTKGYHAWRKMNDIALDENESARPKFMDFKIYADVDHHVAGIGANLLPLSEVGGISATPGEWDASMIHIPSASPGYLAADREMIAVGPNYPGNGASGFNAVSLIEGYAASRALPDVKDPNMPDDMSDADGTQPENWITALFNDGTQQESDVLEHLRLDNNIAPYPFENDGAHADTMYPNGANQLEGLAIHDFELVTGTTVGGTTRIKGGLFPCGLIKFFCRNLDTVPTLYTLTVDLIPGPHRGYMAQSMLEG